MAEAQVTGQLEHPGIVPVHDLGTDDEGRPFYVMKFVRRPDPQGGDRRLPCQRASRGRLARDPPPSSAGNLRRLCQAVAYTHSKGVLHRDLKPDNVMVGSFGETIVIDWGLAKVVGHPVVKGGTDIVHLPAASGSAPTVAGAYMGSPPHGARAGRGPCR